MGNSSSNHHITRSSRNNEINGVICLTAALLLLLCLFSYSPQDPSLTHFVPSGDPIHNLIGPFWRISIRYSYPAVWLGILPAARLPSVGLVLYLSAGLKTEKTGFFGFSALIWLFAGFFLFCSEFSVYGVQHKSGGLLERFLLIFLLPLLSPTGTFILLFFTLTLSLMILFRFSLMSSGNRLKAGLTAGGQTVIYLLRKGRSLLTKKEKQPHISKQKTAPQPVTTKPEYQELPTPVPHREFYTFNRRFRFLTSKSCRILKIKKDALLANSRTVEKTQARFRRGGKVVEVQPGPVVTLYELELAPVSRSTGSRRFPMILALAIKAPSIR
jgi:S-DNA-T family DNA segregation ATPase FtsK/SpoIIIE